MTEQEIRSLVRSVIAQHGTRAAAHSAPDPTVIPLADIRQHASHAQFVLPAESDGACVIEPAVTCNHCGYCKSYGH